jgi:hypothetical protein
MQTQQIYQTPLCSIFDTLHRAKITPSGRCVPAANDVSRSIDNFYHRSIKLACLLTYLITGWCRVLLEKLTGLQLVKKFPAFHGTRRFITALTRIRHLFVSWTSPIQFTYPHPTSWRSVLILSPHLPLGLPSGLFPSGFPTKTLYTPLSSQIRPNIIPPSTPRSPQWSLSLRFSPPRPYTPPLLTDPS